MVPKEEKFHGRGKLMIRCKDSLIHVFRKANKNCDFSLKKSSKLFILSSFQPEYRDFVEFTHTIHLISVLQE